MSTSELDDLRATLDELRKSVLVKLAGLSEEQARRSTVPSGTNLAGLVQHLTFAESKWFEQNLARGKASRGARSMTVDPSKPLREIRAEYREAWASSDAIIESVGDPDARVDVNGKQRTLRWVMLGMINETARHAGHADIIREQIDGRTGR